MSYCGHSKYDASVPLTGVTAFVRYCHVCQGFSAVVYSFSQSGDTQMEPHAEAEMQFGPFDTSDTVLYWVVARITDQFDALGRPWVSDAPEPVKPGEQLGLERDES